jgi:hypothetical protein
VWVVRKLVSIAIIGTALSLGPIHGWWQTPLFVFGMVFSIYHEAFPRFQVWQHVND